MNQKRIDLQQQPLSLKEVMLILALKYQGTLFPEDFIKYIWTIEQLLWSITFLKRTKWADWNLPLNTSYGVKNSGMVLISVMSQSLTCSVVTGESLFDTALRNNICLSALKVVLNLEEEMWWCLPWFLDSGTRPLVRLHGKINATVYKEILKKHVAPNLRTAINQPAVFMPENIPCHTAKSVKTFLSEEDVAVMEWPAQSPDINLIENVWKIRNERAKENNSRNVKGLWTNLKGEWEKISVDEYKTLIHLCSKRCQAVIENKGLHIKY